MRIAPRAFFRPEAAAKHRANIERIEIIRRNDSARGALRPIAHAQRRPHYPINYERFEKRRVLFQIDKVRIRQAVTFRCPACCPAQGEHSVLVRNQRVGANQNSFDPAKDGGIRSDAEC